MYQTFQIKCNKLSKNDKEDYFMKRKMTSIILAMALAITALSGCSKASTETKTTDTDKIAETPTTEKKEGPSWTWDTEPVELSVFVVESGYQKDWDPKNMAYDKKVTDETGLTFKFTSGDENKLNAVIASGDMPDIISMWVGYPQRKMLEDSEQLYALEDLITQYAPTFTSIPKSMMDWFKNDKTGKTYATANYFYTPELLTDEVYLTSHNRITARADIMKDLGLTAEDFTTKEKFKNSLKKVKDTKVQYNGFEVIPFMLGAAVPSQSVEFLANYFGVAYEDGETGDWKDFRKEPETLEALLFANDLYREGLLSVESLTIDNKQLEEKVAGGSIFATTGMIGSQAKALTASDPNAYMVPIGPLKGDNGKEPYLRSTVSSGWQSVMITKKCKYPDRAIRFIEYLMTPEKMLEANVGLEGTVWNMDPDGKIVYTEQFLADKKADPQNINKKYGITDLMFTHNDMIIQPYMPLPEDKASLNLVELDKYYAKFTYNSIVFDELVPQAATEEAEIGAKLNAVWDQAIASVITAENQEKATAAYEQAIASMDKEGWPTWYEAQNKLFKERKAKLGVEFAHPYNQ